MVTFVFEDMTAEKMADRRNENDCTARGIWKGHRGVLWTIKFAKCALLSIAAGWLLTGCEDSRLVEVEKLMETDVEMADSLLYSMEEPESRRDKALYAMLKTQIDYKMYRDAVNDSTIRIATDYYGKRYKDYHAAMAWYSLGCISAELGQDSTAADAYLTAMALFPDTMVRYYALAEQNLSYIYLDHKMDAEAIQLIKACRANAERLNDSAAIVFCDYNIANSLLYNNDYAEAKEMFLKLKDNKWMSPNTSDIPLLQLSKINLLYDLDYLSAITYIDSFLVRNDHINSYGTAYSLKADSYYNLGQLDSALLYYELSLADVDDLYTLCNSLRYLAEIHSLIGNHDSATYYTKQVSVWADSIVSVSNSDNILRALLNHTQFSIVPKSKQHIIFIILIAIFFIVSLYLLLFTYYKNAHKEPQSILDFTQDIEDFKKCELYGFMARTINKHEAPETKEKNSFIKEFRNSLLNIRTFIAISSKANDDDIDFCIYTMLGFNQKDFNTLFNVSQSRTLKHRLKGKMSESMFNSIFVITNDIKSV